MAYDPADLKLPHWLLRSLDLLIAISIPLGWSWRLGFTRPGIIFFAALLGIWAAAFYSGNNLLYLCGAMLTAISATALLHARRILRSFPDPVPLLPYLQHNSTTIVHKQSNSELAAAAVVNVQCRYGVGGDNEMIELTGRCESGRMRLQGQIKPRQRGVFQCYAQIGRASGRERGEIAEWPAGR
mgnify:CR=1 FL=1